MTTALTFVESPPGLAPLVDFDLDVVDGAPGLYTLRAETGLRLFLVDAPIYVPWYEPELDEESLAMVGASAGEPDVMVVATISDGAPIVNLMAPVLVNRRTGAAAQVILGDEWPLRAQLQRPGAA
jgi:flagellar assembly factor FliW